MATCYLLGVSTRRMDKLVETLGITSLSKSQVCVMAKELDVAVDAFRTRPLDAGPYTFVAADALVLKVREGGRAVNVHALIAVGVNAEGHREILGIDDDEVALSEMEIRHVAPSLRSDSPGALTRAPGPFLMHAVGAASSPEERIIQTALDVVLSACGPVDTGRACLAFRDGQCTAPGAFDAEDIDRLPNVGTHFDPDARVHRPRTPTTAR